MSDAITLLKRLDREIWIITAAHEGERGGLVATTFTSASIVPQRPRVVVGIARQHRTWELIEASGCFAAHLIPDGRLDLVQRFGLHSGRDIDKFEGLATTTSETGAPLLTDAAGWLECRVEEAWSSGDRSFYLAEVVRARAPAEDSCVLTMHRLLDQADDEFKAELKRQLEADAERDLPLIDGWRRARK